jgi:transcriptional regulator with XRE-family HTH domain
MGQGDGAMLGDWIKRARRARDWTQGELAARAGYIQHLEANRRLSPRRDILEGLARAFGVSVDQLLKETSDIEGAFPADRLRAEGLPEQHIAELTELWAAYPADRAALLESAHSLARVNARLNQLTTRLKQEYGDAPQVEPPHDRAAETAPDPVPERHAS